MNRLRLPLLYLLSFTLSLGPVLVYFFINLDKYVTSVADAVRLSFGGVIILGVVLLKVVGLLKMPPRIVLFALVFAGCYLLSSILNDLIIFSFLALIGEIGDSVCQIFIRREKERRLIEKTARATATALESSFTGRV
ncbi:MAG: hypothetical protein IJ309_04845 [Clostridia bacterium]|nr:hypothetical protein [Clostridia bacterium]